MIDRLYRAMSPIWTIYLSIKVGEKFDEYQKRFGDKLKYLQPGTFTKPMLDNMDFIVHPGSTLGIEAHLSGVPGQSFCGLFNQTKGYAYPHVHPDTENIDELIDRVKKTPLGKSNADIAAVAELEQEFYGKIDGKAMERAARLIADLPVRPTKVPDIWPPETIEYTFPGVFKQQVTWICEACQKPNFVGDPSISMIKCLACGISLSRR
jgi:hypothetical protein